MTNLNVPLYTLWAATTQLKMLPNFCCQKSLIIQSSTFSALPFPGTSTTALCMLNSGAKSQPKTEWFDSGLFPLQHITQLIPTHTHTDTHARKQSPVWSEWNCRKCGVEQRVRHNSWQFLVRRVNKNPFLVPQATSTYTLSIALHWSIPIFQGQKSKPWAMGGNCRILQ